jgi:hypothetical protein
VSKMLEVECELEMLIAEDIQEVILEDFLE